MSSGNTQSCSQQQSWQHGNSTTAEVHRGQYIVAIPDAIHKANRILEKIDERWPANSKTPAQ